MDGALHIKGKSYALHTVTENAAAARMTIKLLSELFQLETEVTVRRSHLQKTNNYVIYIPPQPNLDQALNELGILNDSLHIKYGILPRLIRKSCCTIAYLRGSFMGGGFISDPRKEHHFELTTQNRELAYDLQNLLKKIELPAKISNRRRNFAVYLTESKPMAEFLALVGAYSAHCTWENVGIFKGMRNQVNRLVNCETANLNKTIEAALTQLSDITLIGEEVGLGAIPKSLREIAKVRIRHPYVSLKELGKLCKPSLSKSAVYHRVKRLSKIAEYLRDQSRRRLNRAAN
jgi:DNA-binding protein WhiA